MNKIFKTIWNAAKRCYAVVGELRRSRKGSTTTARVALSQKPKPEPIKSHRMPIPTVLVLALATIFQASPALAEFIVEEGETVTLTSGGSTTEDFYIYGTLISTSEYGLGGHQLYNYGTVTATSGSTWMDIENSGYFAVTTLRARSVTNSGTFMTTSGFMELTNLTNTGSVSTPGALTVANILENTSSEAIIESADSLKAETISSNLGTITAKIIEVSDGITNSNTINATTSLSAGSLTNTGSIAVENGTITVVKTLANSEENAYITADKLTAGNINNSASISATTSLTTDTYTATEGGYLSAGTMTVLETLSQEDGASIEVATVNAMGEVDNAGSISTTKNMYAMDTLNNSGSMEIGGALNLEGLASNSGTLTVTGLTSIGEKLVNTGTMNLGTVELNAGAELESSGDSDAFAEIGHLMADAGSIIYADGGSMVLDYLTADDVTYYQTGGTMEVDKGWFTNSTLYIYGGVLDDSQNSTASLGNNTIYVESKTGATYDPDNVDADYITNQGLAAVIANTVTSETTIEVGAGGVLAATTLDLDGTTSNSITIKDGGVLQTTADQLFDGVGVEGYYLDAESTDDETYLDTDVLASTAVGDVKDSIITGIDFQTGSNLVIADEHYATSMITSVAKSIANTYGSDTISSINFLGEITGAFTVDTVRALEEEGLAEVESPGVVLSGVTLENSYQGDTTYQKLYVGYEDEEITDGYTYNLSIGFQDVSNADTVEIANGYEFALTGQSYSDETSYLDHQLLLDASDGGTVTIHDGTFTMGSHASLIATMGWVNLVEMDDSASALNTKDGEFGVNTINETAGTISVSSDAVLHIEQANLAGDMVNEGVAYITELQMKEGGTLTNQGTLWADSQEQTLEAGTVANESEAHFDGLTITGGQLTNSENAVVYDSAMTIAMSDSSETGVAGSGQLSVDKLEVQSGIVDGSYIANDDNSTVINVAEDGVIQNATGDIDSITNEGSVQFDSLKANTVVNGSADTNTTNLALTALSTDSDIVSDRTLTADMSKYEELDSSSIIDMSAAEDDTEDDGQEGNTEGEGFSSDEQSSENGATSSSTKVASMNVTDADYDSFTNYAGAEAEFGTLAVNTLVNQGTITVDTSATINNAGTADNSGTIIGEGELAVEDSATLTNSGDITIATLILEEGSEFVNNSGESEVATLNANSGSIFTINDGTFIADSLVSDGEVTYNQYGGTFKINEGFFTDSELNIYGGTLDASENSTGSLGNNVINISSASGATLGEINDEDDVDTKYAALDGLSKVLANTLTSDTTVNVYEGGLLYAENLDFDGTEDTVNLYGGALMTTADQLFNHVESEAIALDATDPETGKVTLESELISETAVGDMKEEVIAALNVAEASNLLIADDYFSSSLIISVQNALADGLGDDAQNLTVNFMGDMTGRMTVDLVHQLEDEGLSEVQNPGIVLNTTTLWNETEETGTDNRGLIVGSSEAEDGYNAFETSMGFMNIENADEVRIVNGKELALVGQVASDENTDYSSDDNKLLTDSEDGGLIIVEDGTFTMGTYGAEKSSLGWVNEVELQTSDSTLQTKNGEFAAWTITNEGLVNVGANSSLHTNTITGGGDITIDGNLIIADNDNAALENAEGATITIGTDGYLDARAIDTMEVNGTIVSSGEANYSDMVIESTGSVTNMGYERGEYLTVNGVHANSGTSIWLGLDVKSGGEVDNDGNMTIGDDLNVEEGGTLENGEDGVIDASTTDEADIDGIVHNKGTIHWHDVNIGSTGEMTNDGTENGNHLHIHGHYTNNGDATWNDGVEVDDGGVLDNTGNMDIDNQFDIDEGGEVNNGEDGLIDATDMDEAKDDGVVNNDGTILWPDLNIGENGEDNNNGYEEGNHLHNEGHYNNNGEAHWKDGITNDESGTIDNTGDLDVDDELTNEGTINNEEDGTIDATDVPEVDNSGTINNKGTFHYHDMHLHDGGTDNNDGTEDGGTLTIDPDSEWNNHGHADWDKIIHNGGDLNNDGDLNVGDLEQNDGDLNITGGDTDIDGNIDLNGGNIIIGNDEDLSTDNEVNVEMSEVDKSDTNIYVKNNGDLGIGDGSLDWADSINAPNIPDTSSRLVITTPVTTNEGGIAVGPNVWTDDDNHVDLGNGDLYFADGSTTIIDASMLTDGTSAFTSTSDGAKVTVEEGATLILSGITEAGDYTITKNYDTTGNVDSDGNWIGGWITEDNLYAIDISGIEWTLSLEHTDDSIIVNAQLGDVMSAYPGVAIPNISNDMMQECVNGSGNNFVCGILRDTNLSTDEKTRILNSVANIAFAGGAASVSMGDLTTAIDSVHNHLTFDSDNFNSDGYLWESDRNARVWLDVNGGWSQSKHLSASGISSASYKTSAYGFVLGVDKKFEDLNMVVGLAYSFNDGNLKSKGGVSYTKNDYQSYGAHVYANWSPMPLFNLIGSFNYLHNNSSIKQTIGAAGFGSATAGVHTNMYALGVRAETAFRLNDAFQLFPHVEVRWINSNAGTYDTKVDGKKLWSNDQKATNVVQFPIGVAYRGDIATDSGWNIRPAVDVSVIPQAGNTKTKTTLNYKGVSDDVTGEFMGHIGYQARVGLQVEKGNFSYGLRYGFTGGSKGRADHSAKIEARWRF